jgi:O-antigen ligase
MYQFRSVNMIEFGFRLLCAGGFVVMATSVSDAKWLKRIAVIILVPGLYNLFNSLIGGRIPLAAPWWPLLVLLPASYFWAIAIEPKSGRLKQAIGFAVIGIAVFVILVKNISWVSGWLGLGASLAAVTLVRNKRLFLVGLIAVVIVIVAYKPFFYEKVIVESGKAGDYDRFDLMRGAWKYATTFPLGVGPGNYRSYNTFYYGRKWDTTAYTSAHGSYSQHLAEMGIPGLILFLAIPICGARWLFRRYRGMPDGFPRTLVVAVIGQIAGISFAAFIGDYIIPTYHNGGLMNFSSTVYSWLIWGLAVAAVRIEERRTESPAVVRAEIREAPLVPALATTHIHERRA